MNFKKTESEIKNRERSLHNYHKNVNQKCKIIMMESINKLDCRADLAVNKFNFICDNKDEILNVYKTPGRLNDYLSAVMECRNNFELNELKNDFAKD